ncbi:hypothetical protein F4677DRAFT_419907 [Hypoxylon crocopeplum]|nr:hypothetical protein F4677DRAFT_419907 [Hypoxylon crocopeplum]
MPQRRPMSSLFVRWLRQPNEKISRVPISITAREPVPLERGRSSIAYLPNDVIFRILGFVQDSSTEDILTVASLSSSLYAQARYVQHRVVHIDLDNSRHAHDRLDLLVRCHLLPAVRMLEVSGSHYDELQEENIEVIARLADMLPSMTGLRDLDWKVGQKTAIPIPSAILEPLPRPLRLHTSVTCTYTSESHAQAHEFLARLTNNQSLFALSVRVSFITEEQCLETMRALKKVLLSCSNLRRLPWIDVWYPRGGFPGGGPGIDSLYCGLGLSGGERPPALEELGITYYPWGQENKPPVRVYCIGYPEKGTEVEYWAKTFDWSQLIKLTELPPELAGLIAPKLTRLREVLYQEQLGFWDMSTFINDIASPLELLTIPSWTHVGNKPDAMIRHGSSLRKLKMHQCERLWKPNSCVAGPDLAQLSNGLPRLEELVIDIARDEGTNDWPYGALDAIANFPSLRTVELWFGLGDGSTPPPTPFLTISSARHLFGYLRERSSSVQRLILHSGAPVNFTLSGKPSWEMQNSITFVCNIVYNGDAEEGFLEVTCSNLSRELNSQLYRLAQGDGDRIPTAELDARTLPLKLALDGPLTMDEWTVWSRQDWIRRQNAYREQHSKLRKFIIGPLKRAWK